jgi:probable HAF family extracellular repeat protein
LYGEIAGYSVLADGATSHAFFWADGWMVDLGTLPGLAASGAYGINDAGQVVGSAANTYADQTAVLWWAGATYDLNALIAPTDPAHGTVQLTGAFGVNNWGQIGALGYYTAGPNKGADTTLILNPIFDPVPGNNIALRR